MKYKIEISHSEEPTEGNRYGSSVTDFEIVVDATDGLFARLVIAICKICCDPIPAVLEKVFGNKPDKPGDSK